MIKKKFAFSFKMTCSYRSPDKTGYKYYGLYVNNKAIRDSWVLESRIKYCDCDYLGIHDNICPNGENCTEGYECNFYPSQETCICQLLMDYKVRTNVSVNYDYNYSFKNLSEAKRVLVENYAKAYFANIEKQKKRKETVLRKKLKVSIKDKISKKKIISKK